MKKAVFLLVSIISLNVFAQTEVSSTINKVTVFKQNAEIIRNISINTTSGTQEIILTGISTFINPSSLQIQFNNSNSTLLSAKYERNYLLSNTINPKIKNLQNQLDDLNDELSWIDDKKNSLKGMEAILNKNQDLGGRNTSFTPNQVIELSNAYKTKYLQIRKELKTVIKKEKTVKEKKERIKKQLNEMNAKYNRPSGNIILQIASKTAKTANIKCKYTVNNAGWNPLYDLRSEGISKNVQLNYKANIYQNTGQDWENVNIVISTGNPSQNNNSPILSPLYASIYQPQIREYREMALDEVVEAEAAPVMALQKSKKYRDGFNYNTQMGENQLNVEYNILNKQSVISDGKENVMALKSYELSTEYIYYTVPKLNKGAFLLAKISDWSKYNLVSGRANIFFEGAFVGQSQINPQVTSDTLSISMGRDNGIVVERKPIKEFTSSKLVGTNKKETFGYELIVKNKKNIPIDIEILDQVPISQNKLIQITIEEKGTAKYQKETGKLVWKLNIQSGQTKKEKFIYTVKYPKKRIAVGIK